MSSAVSVLKGVPIITLGSLKSRKNRNPGMPIFTGCVYFHDTGSHAAPNRADNGNLWKFGATFLHGTVFAPKQSLCEKEGTSMESLKL